MEGIRIIFKGKKVVRILYRKCSYILLQSTDNLSLEFLLLSNGATGEMRR